VLELACGDGFNTRNFYSLKSSRIVACDIDADVIATARRKNAAPNVEYLVCDIKRGLPAGTFDNIVWDVSADPNLLFFSRFERACSSSLVFF